jgi:serine protease
VAGVAALLASLPEFNTPDKIRAALEGTALDLGPVCRDLYYGFGLVQAFDAVQFNPADPPPKCYYYLSGSRTSLRVLSQKRLRTSLRVFETYSAS